jgi:hypothetical protein
VFGKLPNYLVDEYTTTSTPGCCVTGNLLEPFNQ